MNQPTITSYNGVPNTNPFTYYALCKGENAGKPLKQPCPNCFVVTCTSTTERDYFYWLTWGLWKSKTFHYYLRGSVIPFIRICDYKAVIACTGLESVTNPEQLTQAVNTMLTLEQLETATLQKLNTIKQMRIAIHAKLLRRPA